MMIFVIIFIGDHHNIHSTPPSPTPNPTEAKAKTKDTDQE
jgi:hypothetical protein